jgi:hypothetical protein
MTEDHTILTLSLRVVDVDVDRALFPRLTTLVALKSHFGFFEPCYSHHSLNLWLNYHLS